MTTADPATMCGASALVLRSHFHFCSKEKGHRDAHVCMGCGAEFLPPLERGDAYEGPPD